VAHGRVAALRRVALLLAAAVAAVAGCNSSASQGPTISPGPVTETVVPIGATPWPNGTTGAYGLRIDPSLSSNLPSSVGGNPLQEDALIEAAALDDSHYAAAFTSYYVAGVGEITDLNWVEASLGLLKDGAQTEDFYKSWRDDWFQATCSQAGGIGSTSVQSINDWQVDVATCKGGVDAYVLSLDNGVLLSIADLGPRRLGKQLIQGIN
jgi:hypothetical protein